MPSVRKYFVCANSAQGFRNYFPEALTGLRRVYILKGGPGTGKSTLMRRLGEEFLALGEDVDYIVCSSDPASLDGVILCNRKIAVVDGTAPHIIEPTAPGAIEEYLNLGVLWDSKKLIPHREEILHLKEEIRLRYQEIYRLLADAKEIHDRWEAVYQEKTDYIALDQIAQDTQARILGTLPDKEPPKPAVHRFFGALTPTGSIHFIEDLTADCRTRYFIKGRPGTGKSTLLKRLAEQATKKGLLTELYHCSFDAESLDMVILPELSLCAFDATPPHELFPCRDSDIILDLYELAVRPGTDEENHELLSLFHREYQEKLSSARTLLGQVRELHTALEGIYGTAMDFSKMDGIYQGLKREMLEL